uniref:Uncharacterized protein n=1 Tax=viral metagenome TaxID=1070528 RepID=A0A6C0BC22_9ZZZZ
MTSFQLTRYLYIKDEVKLSILISLLKKNHQALFWAYEFYYSGFKTELWEFLWMIYFQFYATLNPGFYSFIKKKHDLWKQEEDDALIAHIINNFHIRPWNPDVFLLKQNLKNKVDHLHLDVATLLHTHNYTGIAYYIENCTFTAQDADATIQYFLKQNIADNRMNTWKNKKKIQAKCKDELLSDIIHFYSVVANLTMGKNLYLTTSNEDLTQYKTMYSCYDTNFYAYKILPLVTKYAIDSEKMLGLFTLSRDTYQDLQKIYHYHWLYYARNTPIWEKRIQEFEGKPNDEKKDIDFEDEEIEEEFYEHFNYEPDEQKLEVQQRNIGAISTTANWQTIFESFPKGLLFDNALINTQIIKLILE